LFYKFEIYDLDVKAYPSKWIRQR